jgi:Zn-finger in ubiquitin-hydrolases and other protein
VGVERPTAGAARPATGKTPEPRPQRLLDRNRGHACAEQRVATRLHADAGSSAPRLRPDVDGARHGAQAHGKRLGGTLEARHIGAAHPRDDRAATPREQLVDALVICMTCGHVGCCDSSPDRHATAHHHASRHPIIKSLEPGEDWGWCYPDAVTL